MKNQSDFRPAEKWCESEGISITDTFQKVFPAYKYIEVDEKLPTLMNDFHEIVNGTIFNWGTQGDISLNYNIAEGLDAFRIMETGVAYGCSRLSILLIWILDKKDIFVA